MNNSPSLTAPSFILASGSPYRRAQWESRFALPIRCISPDIDEKPLPGEAPAITAQRLSGEKAQAVASLLEMDDAHKPMHNPMKAPTYIIAGDQTAEFEGKLLHKPGTAHKAKEQLSLFQGKSVDFYSGVCVLEVHSGKIKTHVDKTSVHLNPLSEQQIHAYIEADQPVDCVGAFKNETMGIALFKRIESLDPSALTGLPLIALTQLLSEFDVDLLSLSALAAMKSL